MFPRINVMTQEEFDALEDDAPEQPPVSASSDKKTNTSSRSSVVGTAFAAVRSQSPVRLAAFGIAVLGAAIVLTMMPGPDDTNTRASALATEVQPVSAVLQQTAVTSTQDSAQPDPSSTTVTAATNSLPSLPADPDTFATLAPAPIRKIENLRPTQAAVATPDCTVTVDAKPQAGAIVGLYIAAPCDGAARADILQGDLQIAVALDENGMAQVAMPALSAMAVIAVAVADRDPVNQITTVADMDDYARTVLYWQNDVGLELHAFEDDADYGTDGHIAPETPRNIARILSGNGGYLTTLGDATLDDARVALVYTAPASQAVAISIEAPVLASNCGQQIVAGTIQATPGIATITQNLTFRMPGCEAEGEYVMLGDLVAPVAQVDVASN